MFYISDDSSDQHWEFHPKDWSTRSSCQKRSERYNKQATANAYMYLSMFSKIQVLENSEHVVFQKHVFKETKLVVSKIFGLFSPCSLFSFSSCGWYEN